MTTLFVGDLQFNATKFHISKVLKQIGLFSNLIVTKHSRKKTKIAFFDVGVTELEKFLATPVVMQGVEHYAQLSQNQPNISLEVLEIQKRRLFVEKLPTGLKDQVLESFFKQIFGEENICSFFSVKNRNKKSKGYGFLHVTGKKFALELLKIKKVKFQGKTILFKPFKQKFKQGVMAQIERLQKIQKQSELPTLSNLEKAETPRGWMKNRSSQHRGKIMGMPAFNQNQPINCYIADTQRRNTPRSMRGFSSFQQHVSSQNLRKVEIAHLEERLESTVLDRILFRSRFLSHSSSNVVLNKRF
jgi:RNA recognition motif-containing protein